MEGQPYLRRLAEKVAEAAIRLALGYLVASDADEKLMAIARGLAARLASFDGASYHCGMCGKGPFTRKGLYLHIRRVHYEQLVEVAVLELKRAIVSAANR